MIDAYKLDGDIGSCRALGFSPWRVKYALRRPNGGDVLAEAEVRVLAQSKEMARMFVFNSIMVAAHFAKTCSDTCVRPDEVGFSVFGAEEETKT